MTGCGWWLRVHTIATMIPPCVLALSPYYLGPAQARREARDRITSKRQLLNGHVQMPVPMATDAESTAAFGSWKTQNSIMKMFEDRLGCKNYIEPSGRLLPQPIKVDDLQVRGVLTPHPRHRSSFLVPTFCFASPTVHSLRDLTDSMATTLLRHMLRDGAISSWRRRRELLEACSP